MAETKAMVHRRRFLKTLSLKFCDIWQNFYFYRILNNENFKMKVEQTNFVTLNNYSSAGSRPCDKVGGGRSFRPLDKGERSPKKFFSPLGTQFGLRIKGGGVGPQAPPLDLPLYRTIILLIIKELVC